MRFPQQAMETEQETGLMHAVTAVFHLSGPGRSYSLGDEGANPLVVIGVQ